MTPIDHLFTEANTAKVLPVRPTLWRRVEKELDVRHKRKQAVWRGLMIAASLLVLTMSIYAINKSGNHPYLLEEIGTDYDTFLSKQEMTKMHLYYDHLQSGDLNG